MKNVLALILLLLCFVKVSAQTAEKNIPLIEKKTVESWVNYLADDSMLGRKNGSDEMKKAAAWLAGKFKEFGVKPFKEYADYTQHYYIKRSKTDSIPESNIIGFIEGSDPKLKNEYILLTAHFDHIGFRKGMLPDSIFNGANDNASGTCALLGVAKTIQMMKAKPGRTIIIAAVSGEEMGMRGSRYFAGHAPVDISKVYLNLNFEMLGHCKIIGENKYQITGPAITSLKDMLHEYNKNSTWKLVDTVKNLSQLFYASDNIAFAAMVRKDNFNYGVPAHTFVTHEGEDHVHKVNDEAKYFNFDNYRNFMQYITGVTLYMAKSIKPIVWKSPNFKSIREFQSNAK
jgi:alpha-D-ribose 1-methylphosphonate 5-triphosphate synthase subunit PhnG